MKPADYCAWPPRLASDVESAPRNDGERAAFIAGSASVGRYLILGAAEYRVVHLLDGTRTAAEVCAEFLPAPPAGTLTRFLSKLDEVGMLAGERAQGPVQALLPCNQVYLRWSVFHPDRLFTRLLPWLRWIWTPWFFAASVMLLVCMAGMALMNWAEVSRYSGETLRGHYLTILIVAWMVAVCHEFAHGLTSKAFGGRATEVGVLLIYYVLPALYCNVSGLHLIPRRGQRLWVIAAGVYWQLLVGALALVAWFGFNPVTVPGRLAMAVVLGSLLGVVFNANPLIKLDGYYFLSQWLGMPNLMNRSREYWRGLLGGSQTARFSRRERRILCVFGLISFFYNLALPAAIVWHAGQYLMDRFQFAGLLVSVVMVLMYAWRLLKRVPPAKGGDVATKETRAGRTRRLAPAAIAVCFAAILCMPWRASVGSYGTLLAIPGREAVIRAPENASLIALRVQPGQHVERGEAMGRMANLDLEDQIVQVRTELARVNADIGRLSGELRVQQVSAGGEEWRLAARQREFEDIEAEERQIQARMDTGSEGGLLLASYGRNASYSAPSRPLPAALAVLESHAERLGTQLEEANRRRGRARALFTERVLSRSDLEAAEAQSSALLFERNAAWEGLRAALVEHRRRHANAEAAFHAAGSGLSAARAQAESLSLQLQAAGRLSGSLEERLALLERKRGQFELAAPVTGTIFGDDLPRMTGQYFNKGAEICRVVESRELLVRVQVAEQAVGDIAVGYTVRVKTRAFPDRVFHGVISRVGGESEVDASGQRSYRVELTIQNAEGLLRPGMTVFARVDFGRRMVASLLAHKLKQALRPETWML
jgi:putative peptide zinc metalloprotease protein